MNHVATEQRPAASVVDFKRYKPRPGSTLRGYAKIAFPSGLVIGSIAIHANNEGWGWAVPPTGCLLASADGRVLLDAGGRKRHAAPLIEFTGPIASGRWSATVVAAVRAACPAALAAAPDTKDATP